jgi:hypothetical protein
MSSSLKVSQGLGFAARYCPDVTLRKGTARPAVPREREEARQERSGADTRGRGTRQAHKAAIGEAGGLVVRGRTIPRAGCFWSSVGGHHSFTWGWEGDVYRRRQLGSLV